MKAYECPVCGEWIEWDAENGNDTTRCPNAECKALIYFEADADFDGGWHDKSRFIGIPELKE